MTVLAGLILVGVLLFFGVVALVSPKLVAVSEPERALALVVGTDMDLEEGLERAAPWEQRLNDWMSGTTSGEEREMAMDWYDELLDYEPSPSAALQLAILGARAGQRDWLGDWLTEWDAADAPMPLLATIVRQAFFDAPVSQHDVLTIQELRLLLPVDWFYDQLISHWAVRFDSPPLLALAREREAALPARAARSVWWNRVWLGVEAGLMLAGGLAVLILLRRRSTGRPLLRCAGALLPPPWKASTGLAVLIRGMALEMLIILLLFLAGSLGGLPDWMTEAVVYPLGALPVLILADRYLLKPSGQKMASGFGLRFSPGQGRGVWRAVGLGVGLQAVGEWGIDLVAGKLGLVTHWTEWFDEALAWGSPVAVCSNIMMTAVVAPIVEELVFRGLLFGTLRRRLRLVPAAMISAVIFASLHGYGWSGWLSVAWSGVLLAWLYEQTGTLVPGMVVHGIGNGLSCAGVLLLRLG
ncbi:MAG: CPBP family intramembrane metalloprotease [Candidatus Omnitrophica bacterium]|nr:CPBP family intramembrane metalloprotease [Candidatus Omnitrophota bacterium]